MYKQLLLLYAYIMPRAKFNTCRDISQDASFPDRACLFSDEEVKALIGQVNFLSREAHE